MEDALRGCPWYGGESHPVFVQDGVGLLAGRWAGERGPVAETQAGTVCRDGLTVAADARLDNREELMAALAIVPADGTELSNAELLLRAYQRWDVDCAARLLGDFVFVIWDSGRQRLVCVRDFVGARPLYYHYQPGRRFTFASDLMALIACPQISRQLNLAYVKAHLLTVPGQYQHPIHTFYQEIEKLPPAHCLIVDRAGLRLHAYWKPDHIPERRYRDEEEYVAELRSLLRSAVACRVQDTGHEVGAHISGGLDSSSLAVLSHQILRAENRAATGISWAPPFSVVAPMEQDERSLVQATAEAGGFAVCYTTLTEDQVLEHAARDITAQPTTTLQLELAASRQAASLGIRTMVSGWGGDELLAFNGRGYFASLLRQGRWLTLQRELALQSRLHGGSVWKSWIRRGIFPYLPAAVLRLLRSQTVRRATTLPAYLRPDFAALLASTQELPRPDLRERPGVRQMQIALLLNGHIPYRLESWAAHGATLGMTYTYPLLDRRLVEFALSIPEELFFKHGWKRYLFRTAMAGILPDEVRWHKVKADPAMVKHVKQVTEAADNRVRAALAERADNLFVDVEQLIAAKEAAARAAEDGSVQARRRRASVERGQWLAFVDPSAVL